jgi:hypothetical protein
MDGDGENEEGAEKEIVGGHAESVVARGDALAKYGVEGEAERTDKGDEIAEESGRGLSGIAGGGEENDAEEGDGHAEDFAERGGFEAKEDSEDQGVDGAHANDVAEWVKKVKVKRRPRAKRTWLTVTPRKPR